MTKRLSFGFRGFLASCAAILSIAGLAEAADPPAPSTLSASGGANPGTDGWTLSTTGNAGSFQGNSGTNAGGSAAGAGNPAWGLYANSGGVSRATRMLGGDLAVGQTVRIDFDNGWIDSGGSVLLEFLSVPDTGSNGTALTLRFQAGQSNYEVVDAAGAVSTNAGFSGDGGTASLTRTGAGTYSFSWRGYTRTGTFAGSYTTVNAVRVTNSNAGPDDPRNLFFNNLVVTCIDADGDGVCADTDCDDADPAVGVATTVYYLDGDGDGYGTSATTQTACTAPVGYVSNDDDCDDARSSVYPGATELCDGLDNDCDLAIDEGLSSATYYRDADSDGYGTSADSQTTCTGSAPTGYVATAGDCDDANGAVNPGATEVCNGVDDDCDGSTDEGLTTYTFYADVDGDAYGNSASTSVNCTGVAPGGFVAVDGDCDDADDTVNPGATEVCNTKDDDCDGSTDEGVTTTYYLDGDGDGYGVASSSVEACTLPGGYATVGTDCDDANAAINPAAVDSCDGIDNNCDGVVDPSGCASTDVAGNGRGGFGGAIGGSTLGVAADGADWVFTLTKGSGDFSDALVLYFDAEAGGFSSTAAFTDTGDYLRKAISGTDGTNRSTVNFPAGFTADHVIALTPSGNASFGGGWKLVENGSHEFRGSVALTPSNSVSSATYTFRIARSQFGVTPGGTAKFVGTYLNANNAFRSNEGYGAGLPATNVGQAPCTFTGFLTIPVPCTDADGDGVCADLDCDDADSARYPGAIELCDGIDNDCDTAIDEGLAQYTYYRDADGDGFGDAATTTSTCALVAPSGYVADSTDCDDTAILYADTDGDGFGAGAPVACGVGNNTDGCPDLAALQSPVTYYADGDGDGFGSSTTASFCSTAAPTGYASNSTDCDDTALLYADTDGDGFGAGAPAACGVANNTDGCPTVAALQAAVTYYADGDEDGFGSSTAGAFCSTAAPSGYAATSDDCNDANAAVYPGAAELCANDGVDNDCDGEANADAEATDSLSYFVDGDSDGFGAGSATKSCSAIAGSVTNGTDCDDSSNAIYPGAAELCATVGTDNDCDSDTADIDAAASDKVLYYADSDNDTFTLSTGANFCPGTTNAGYLATASAQVDCNDASNAVYPGAAELCANDGVDNDCDGEAADDAEATDSLSYFVDGDSDGFGAGAATKSCSAIAGSVTNGTDCDDSSNAIYPGAAELCATVGTDNDCDSDTADIDAAASDKVLYYADSDNDTYTLATGANFCPGTTNAGYRATASAQVDCDDTSNQIYPGAAEICANDGVDNDCDGEAADDAEATDSTSYFVDGDSDGFGAGAATKSCSAIAGSVTNGTDCDDSSNAIYPGAAELCATVGTDNDCDSDTADIDAAASDKVLYYADSDNDTFTLSTGANFCPGTTNAGYLATASAQVDCDDTSNQIYPGAAELCANDGVDNDCDGEANADAEAADSLSYYVDGDSDGFGAGTATKSCSAIAGSVTNGTDCDDSSNAIYPGAAELCATVGTDNDCDSDTADIDAAASDKVLYYADSDNDTFTLSTGANFCPGTTNAGYLATASAQVDCNDASNAVYPGAAELCANDGVDNDCDGEAADDAEATDSLSYFVDGDSDGFGAGAATKSCSAIAGSVTNGTDCDDSSNAIYPGAAELCATVGTDNDCDSDTADIDAAASDKVLYYADSDNDTYTLATGANFCPGTTNAGYRATASAQVDCDDASNAVYPGAAELCANDGVDNDCDGEANADAEATDSLSYFVDGDSDGFGAGAATKSCSAIAGSVTNGTDCDDSSNAVYPGAAELCATVGTDNDCDSDTADIDAAAPDKVLYYADSDNDTFTLSTGANFCPGTTNAGYLATASAQVDCDDTSNQIYPGAAELCANDGVDNDCDGEANADAEAADSLSYYVDGDSDGFGAGAATKSCSAIAGSVTNGTDCDDASNAVYPGAAELCATAGTDNDCDSDTADIDAAASDKVLYYADSDNDTFTLSTGANFCPGTTNAGYLATASAQVDCDDTSNQIYPGAAELCANDGVDNDCDGEAADDAEATDSLSYYVDGDSDGFGAGAATKSCSAIAGSVTNGTDCDDASNAVYPGAAELCATAGTDNDCDSDTADIDAAASDKVLYYADSDNDTFTLSTGANFCPGTTNAGYLATASAQVDCNDASNAVYPGAAELCANDGVDNDCDGEAADDAEATDSLSYFVDGDSDGFGAGAATKSCSAIAGSVTNGTDCDDSSNAIYPGAAELCATVGTDNDCDSDTADIDAAASDKVLYYADSDNDTFTLSTGANFCPGTTNAGYLATASAQVDCDDTSNQIYPGAAELCANDGVDNDCDGEAADDAEATDSLSYFVDGDSDGFGAGTATKSCSAIAGSVTNGTDCDDSSNAIYPGAAELCATVGTDNDCDSDTADIDAAASDKVLYYADSDNDTYTLSTGANFCSGTTNAGYLATASAQVDCDDASAAVYPGAPERCADLAIDNDCDGSTDESEAIDPSTFYADADGDGAGDPATSASACVAPTGFVANSSDGCPANPALTAPATYYPDADGDGTGVADGAISSCESTPPSGYAAIAGDGCPSDAAKTDPGTCGCGVPDTDSDSDGTPDCNDDCPLDPLKTSPGDCGCGVPDTDSNANNIPDCLESSPLVTIVADAVQYGMGDSVLVRISTAPIGAAATRVELTVHFDPETLLFVSADPVSGSAFSDLDGVTLDTVAGTIRVALAVPAGSPGSSAANDLVDLDFVVLPGADRCGDSGVVTLAPIGSSVTRFLTTGNQEILPLVSPLGATRFDGTGPVLAGLPESRSIPTDAGSLIGSAIAASTVTATDTCDGDRSLSLAIEYPDLSTGTTWPVDGVFPIGITTLTWTSSDSLGNQSTAVRTIEVLPHQALDADIAFIGSIAGTSTRAIRIAVGDTVHVGTVALTGNVGTVEGIELPLAEDHPCATAKDPVHSVTDGVETTVVDGRWNAAFSLKQGDSNDDDFIDIVDFSIFIASRGAGKAVDAVSNFNGDPFVNTADFTYIAVNFLATGESCGAFTGGTPRERVLVRDLRRAGLGHLAIADLDRDGWIDADDIAWFLEHGAPLPPKSPAPSLAPQW